ncbi:MAG: hypothetical protein ABJE95_11060 [Byssovorax sp.]
MDNELYNRIGLVQADLEPLRQTYREDPCPSRFIRRIVAQNPRIWENLDMVMLDIFRFGAGPLNTLGGWWDWEGPDKLSDERFDQSMGAQIDAKRDRWNK